MPCLFLYEMNWLLFLDDFWDVTYTSRVRSKFR